MPDSAYQKTSFGSEKGLPSEAAGLKSPSSSSGVSGGEKAPEKPVRTRANFDSLHSVRQAPQQWKTRQMQKFDDFTIAGTTMVEAEMLPTSAPGRQSLQQMNLNNSVQPPGREAWVGNSPSYGTPAVSPETGISGYDGLVHGDSSEKAQPRYTEPTDRLEEEDELEASDERSRGRRRGA